MKRVFAWVDEHIAIFVVLGLLGLLALGLKLEGQGVKEGQLRVSQLRACHRLNIIRAEDNRSQLKDYELFSLVAQSIAATLANPQQPETGEQKLQTEAFLKIINSDILGKEWTPLTDCGLAVDHAASYVAPQPRPFGTVGKDGTIKTHLPTPDALHVGPGQ